jgi:Helix-turn-helix domain
VSEACHADGAPDTEPAKPQGRRWQYENAIEKSGLKPLTRLVLATIARRADVQTGMIRAKFMPSAASLAAATGLSERRVRDHLDLAEKAGWLVIERREGRKAMLALTIPGRDMAAEVSTTPDAPSGVTPDAPSDGSDLLVQTEGQDLNLAVENCGSVSPPVDPANAYLDKIENEFQAGRLARARSDVPDCQPSAIHWSERCHRCGAPLKGCVCHLEETEEPWIRLNFSTPHHPGTRSEAAPA